MVACPTGGAIVHGRWFPVLPHSACQARGPWGVPPHRQSPRSGLCVWNDFIFMICTMKFDAVINFVIRNLKYQT